MMCYMDRTFCPFHESCDKGDVCDRALTDEVMADAALWWGTENTPICQYSEKPECHEPK